MTTLYHKPVLLEDSVSGLIWNPQGTYVDLTFGGGGHARAILDRLRGGRLLAFDQDEEAAANAAGLDLTFIEANFRYMKRYLKLYGIRQVDGVLADLGVSSHQFDVADRGFSTRFEATLDMRMNQSARLTAQQIIETYDEGQLQSILSRYGEVKNAKTLAKAIVAARINRPVRTVEDLKAVLSRFTAKGREAKYYAQVFQALRIEVNDEMRALEEMLLQATELLVTGGRLVVIAYHSLEDRLVKNMMMKGNLEGETEQDFFGNVIKPLQLITKKPILPSPDELAQNKRARSAKLRIAEKIDVRY